MRWLLLFTALLMNAGLHASPDAQAVVRQASGELLDRLQASGQQTPDSNALQALVDDTVTRHVDFEAFSRFVLGKHWKRSTPQQRSQFVTLFRQLLVRTYTAALKDAQVAAIRFPAPRRADNDRRALIPTIVELTDGPSIQVSYRMYLHDGRWQIYDVLIENISMTVNYRTEFSHIISNGGIAELLRSLELRNRQATGCALNGIVSSVDAPQRC